MERSLVGMGIWMMSMGGLFAYALSRALENSDTLMYVYGILGLTVVMGGILIIHGSQIKEPWED